MKNAKRNAEDAFLEHYTTIVKQIEMLKEAADDHFDCNPDDIHWGHVGTLAHYSKTLGELLNSINHTGEYAEIG